MTSSTVTDPKPPVARKLGRRPKQATPGREALLDAAYHTFARQGYVGTSLRDVASQARVDVALVARLFGSKAKLWEAVVERLVNFMEPYLLQVASIQAQAMADHLTPQQNAAKRLKALIGLFGRIGHQVPQFPAFVIPEMVDPGERLTYVQQRIVNRMWQACEPIIVDAIATGAVRVTHPFLLFSTLLQSVSLPMLMPSMFWGSPSAPIDPGQAESLLVKEIVAMVMATQDD